jgi:hypothetical protein
MSINVSSFHASLALDLFRSGTRWLLPIDYIEIYKRSSDAEKYKVVSLNLGNLYNDMGKKHVPYLRYYYHQYTKEVESEIQQIREKISAEYMNGNIHIDTQECRNLDLDIHCVLQKDRRCRLTTLNKKYDMLSIEELKHQIKIHPCLSITRKDGHLYVNGLRFKRARCLDAI